MEWVIVGICIAVYFLADILTRPKPFVPEEPAKPEIEAKFYGGPADGKTQMLWEIKNYLVAPYMPEEESERQVVNVGGMQMYQPNLAFYQHMMDGEYVYRRDVTEDDFEYLQTYGTLPSDE